MNIETIVVGPFEVNCYLYWEPESKTGVIIDPGAEAERIINTVERCDFQPAAILLTHGHGDHIAAVEEIRKKYSIDVYIGIGEEALLANPSENISVLVGQPIIVSPAEHLVKDEQLLQFGKIELRVLSTPGHTVGGVCYFDERNGILFTGDTLFWGSIGRTDLTGGSYEQLLESIKTKILQLPDSVICYPGHGPRTTVGGERINNPFLTGGYLV